MFHKNKVQYYNEFILSLKTKKSDFMDENCDYKKSSAGLWSVITIQRVETTKKKIELQSSLEDHKIYLLFFTHPRLCWSTKLGSNPEKNILQHILIYAVSTYKRSQFTEWLTISEHIYWTNYMFDIFGQFSRSNL